MKNLVRLVLLCLLLIATVCGCGKSGKVINGLDDAKDARIGIMTGSASGRIARARFPEARIKDFDEIMDAVAALKAGQIDAIVTVSPTAIQVAKKNPELWRIPEDFGGEAASIALRKGNDKLMGDLNRIIADLKANGTLADISKRWLKTDLSPYDEKKYPVPAEGEVLKVGMTATREPLNFVDKNGRVTGHDAELARIIGARLHRPIQFSNMKFMALVPALQSGKVDVIISGMTATEERKKSVDFTQPYFVNSVVMLVKKSSAGTASKNSPTNQGGAKLASPADLKDKRIGVLLGSIHDGYAMKTYPRATVLQYKNHADLILAVKTGKVDAAFYTYETLIDIIRNDSELAFLGKPLFTVPIGVGFNKNNNRLREEFNQFLRRIKENGVFKGMVNRWITTGDTRMPDIPNTKTNGALVVGIVSDKGLPFTILKDGRMIGFDVELTERFAAHLGKELKLMDMEFGSLVAAAATNKVDMITSTLVITEERKKQVTFSDPYYELGASIFTLKRNLASTDGAASDTAGAKAPPSFLKKIADSFNSNIIQEKRYLLIWDGLKTTVIISVFSTVVGTLLGALVCFMRMSKQRALNLPARFYISVLRGTPVLVLLMLIFYVVFASVSIDPVIVAVIAFGMNFAAYAAEIFRTGIEGVDKGQTEAGIAMGFTKVSTFLHIVLPQTVRRILPVYKGEFISLVKMTSIVGYIAVQDLTKASDIIRSRTFDAFFPLIMVAILYFFISWLLMQSLEYLELRTDPKYKRRKAGNA